MSEKHRSSPERTMKLSVRAAALFLQETEPALRMKIHRGQVPHHRWGKRVFLLADELETFLKALDGVSVEEAMERVAGGGR